MPQHSTCLKNIINIANACLELGYWPSYFKMSTTVVIPKLNKLSYDSPKSFRPIVLLNTLGKLIEKVIGDRLQYFIRFLTTSSIRANLVVSSSNLPLMWAWHSLTSFTWGGLETFLLAPLLLTFHNFFVSKSLVTHFDSW